MRGSGSSIEVDGTAPADPWSNGSAKLESAMQNRISRFKISGGVTLDLGSVVVWPRRFEHQQLISGPFYMSPVRTLNNCHRALHWNGPEISKRQASSCKQQA